MRYYYIVPVLRNFVRCYPFVLFYSEDNFVRRSSRFLNKTKVYFLIQVNIFIDDAF